VTKRGQTVIPAKIRKRYNIKEGTKVEWIDTGTVIKVVPIPEDPLKALKGIAKGEKLLKKLLRERRMERGEQ